MSLALGKSVAETQACVTSAEFSEWMAYDQLDPFGNVRGDMQAGIIAAQVGGGKPSDYMPKFDAPRVQQVNEMKAKMMGFARAHNQARKKRGKQRHR